MPEDFEVVEERPGEHKISLQVNGKKVSWLYVVDLNMHYGKSKITVGGIAGVFTPREFRRKGYSRRTIEHALTWMETKGYSLSALFGIHNYYDKYGFAVFMGECTASLHLRNLSRIKPPMKHQITLSEDPGYKSRETAEIYEENNINRVASIVRNPKVWKGFRKGLSYEHEPKVLVAQEKDVVGYAVLERWPPPQSLVVAEVAARGHNCCVYASLLHELYEMMREESKSSLMLYVAPDDPVTHYLITYGCEFRINYPESGGGMARVISLKRVLMEVEDELKRRSIGFKGDLTIYAPGEVVTIKAKDGEIELKDGAHTANKVKLGWGEAAQLILGYREPNELISSTETHGNPAILEKIFPRTTPYVWQPDRW